MTIDRQEFLARQERIDELEDVLLLVQDELKEVLRLVGEKGESDGMEGDINICLGVIAEALDDHVVAP